MDCRDSYPCFDCLILPNDVSGVIVSWQSVSSRRYFLERAKSVGSASFSLLSSNIFGQADATSYTDTNAQRRRPVLLSGGCPSLTTSKY